MRTRGCCSIRAPVEREMDEGPPPDRKSSPRRRKRPARRGHPGHFVGLGTPVRARASAVDAARRPRSPGGPAGGEAGPLWRSSRNRSSPRDHLPRSNSIFNSAVVPFRDGYAGVFRVDDTPSDDERARGAQPGRCPPGRSTSSRSRSRLRTIASATSRQDFIHAYDPRVTWLEDRYYVTWCNGYHGPTIGVALHARLRDLPPARQRVSPVQPKRRPLSAPDRGELRDAEPSERQRAHPVR